MTVLIVGAGIGGLTTALCLAKCLANRPNNDLVTSASAKTGLAESLHTARHKLIVLEQAPVFAEVGAGLQCGANAMQVFQYLGLAEAIHKLAVQPEQIEFSHFQTGQTLHRVPLGAGYEQRFGAPYLHIHRADLLKILVDQAQKNPNIQIELNAKVTSFEESEGNVKVNIEDGRQFDGALLIGANGLKSTVREQLLQQTPDNQNQTSSFTGSSAWRGVIPRDRLPTAFMDKVTRNFVGQGKHMIVYYLRRQELVNFVGVVESKNPQETSWMSQAPLQELRQDFHGWHSTVEQVINAVDKNACFRWALHAHKPLNNWSTKRMTLLGDAAHATLPYMASGAAMAVEDARILARCLENTELSNQTELAAALQRYQANRMPRTRRVQKTSKHLGALYHIQNDLLLRGAFWGLRNFTGGREDFLPRYNANTIALH